MTRFFPARLWIPLVLSIAITGAILTQAASNRRGTPETIITLTERELGLPYRSPLTSPDTTELALRLRVHESYSPQLSGQPRAPIDEPTMRALGFTCNPRQQATSARETAHDDCSRAQDRPGFVVLEYDGPAWQAHLTAIETGPEQADERQRLSDLRTSESRLMVVDAGPDVAALRRRYPDGTRYLILAARIGANVEVHGKDPNVSIPVEERRLRGRVNALAPSRINVPRELRAFFESLPQPQTPDHLDISFDTERLIDTKPRYELRLAIGQRMEPWIVDVRPLP